MAKALHPPDFNPQRPLSECIPAIVAARVDEINAFEKGVLGGEPDAIHDMRVACRRLQAFLAIFKERFDKRDVKKFKKQLRELIRALGEVRECDVLMATIASAVAPAGQKEQLLCAMLTAPHALERKKRMKALAALFRELRAGRAFDSFLSSMQLFFARPAGKKERPSQSDIFSVCIAAAIEELLREFLPVARPVVLGPASDNELHKVRILGKPLRYAMELPGPFLKGPFNDCFLEVKQCIRDLGEIHDIDLCRPQVASFALQIREINRMVDEKSARLPASLAAKAVKKLEERRGELLSGLRALLQKWEECNFSGRVAASLAPGKWPSANH